jgi:hypothetical protein
MIKHRMTMLELDDTLAGFGDIGPGDHVALTLRGEPGRRRVSEIIKLAPPPDAAASSREPADDGTAGQTSPADVFAAEVARLAQEATRVDRVWASRPPRGVAGR